VQIGGNLEERFMVMVDSPAPFSAKIPPNVDKRKGKPVAESFFTKMVPNGLTMVGRKWSRSPRRR
jgi:hypothetical protein